MTKKTPQHTSPRKAWTKGKMSTLVHGCLVILSLIGLCQSLDAKPIKVVTVSTPSGCKAMSAKIDGRGMVHLVYDTHDGPKYARYDTDRGQYVGEPLALVDEASHKPGLEFITWDMVVTSEGTVHVALGNNAWKLKLPKEEWGYFYTRLRPTDTAFVPLKNINHIPSEGFSLAANEVGKVSAVWMADKLYVNVSRDGGDTFAATVEIDPLLDPCNCCTTSSVYGSDGKLAILYREETNNERDMYLALWDQEKNKSTKTRISTIPWKIDSCPMTYYSVVRDGEGFVVAWPTKGEIYFTKLASDGSPVNSMEIKTPGKNGMRSGILPVPTNDGHTLLVWKKDNELGWQLYDRSGRPSGDTAYIKSAGSGAAGVLSRSGDVILFQ